MKALLYPKFALNLLPAMLGYAVLGALVAGCYGVLHDQITYSISPEYFTRLKFVQFHYADFGLPPRFFVAEIGFLATWWVGLIAGWFLARVVVPTRHPLEARTYVLRGFAIILSCGFAGSLLGFSWGLLRGPNADYADWNGFVATHGVVDLPSFVRVAYIHNASYLGGLIGLIVALIHVRRPKQQMGPGQRSSVVARAVLPFACEWAKRQESTILRTGVPLSASQADTAEKMGILHPEHVRLRAVAQVPPVNWLLRRVGERLGYVSGQTIGMALRYGIFIRKDHWGDRRLLIHELAHVAQYERMGGFRGFLKQYLQECTNPGYPLGELEQEAKRAESACR